MNNSCSYSLKTLVLSIFSVVSTASVAQNTLNGFRRDEQPPMEYFNAGSSGVSFGQGLPLPALTTGNSSLSSTGSRIDERLHTVHDETIIWPAIGKRKALYEANQHVGKIKMIVDRRSVPADGQSPVYLSIELFDYNGQPLQTEATITVEASAGRLLIPDASTCEVGPGRQDLDRAAPGLQIAVRQGHEGIFLLAPEVPQDVSVRVTAGQAQVQGIVTFVPELRDMIGVGLVEGMIRLHNKSPLQISGAPREDGFEQEIQMWSRSTHHGKREGAWRSAFFLKGKIRGNALLTAAFDSDKDTRNRLFRDIHPDTFYPVYGDASMHGFDAQSESRLYVRVDKEKSYLLYGDFNTGVGFSEFMGGGNVASIAKRDLGNYSRSFNGARAHYEKNKAMLDAFIIKDSQMLFIEEFPAQGTSGPFAVSKANTLVNSEKVEIITRDRYQPAVILSTLALQRYVDYSFEPFSGRILLNRAIPSVDSNSNPKSVRITYEVDTGGEHFWVGGVSGQAKIYNQLEVGGSYVHDKNPLAPYTLMSANTAVALTTHTSFVAEIARSKSILGDIARGLQSSLYGLRPIRSGTPSGVLKEVHGNAFRAELLHQTAQTQARAYIGRSDPDFDNPAASLMQGREEAVVKVTHVLSGKENTEKPPLFFPIALYTVVHHTKDRAANAFRNAFEVGAAYRVQPSWAVDVALTHTKEQAGHYLNLPLSLGSGFLVNPQNTYGFGNSLLNPQSGYGLNGTNYGLAGISNHSTGVRLRSNYVVTQNVDIMGEFEQGFAGEHYRRAGVGSAYRFSEMGRLYGKYEWLSALASPQATDDVYRSSAFVFGVENQTLQSQHTRQKMFSEYRMRDAISASDLIWASGLRQSWDINEQWRVSGSAEYLHAYRDATASATALTAATEWRPSELLLLGNRFEWRCTQNSTVTHADLDNPSNPPMTHVNHGSDTYLSVLSLARKLNRDWAFLGRHYLLYTDNRGNVPNLWEDRFQLGMAYRDTDINRFNALVRYEFWVKHGDKSGLTFTPDKGFGDGFNANGGYSEGLTKHIFSLHGNWHPRRPWWINGRVAAKWQKDDFRGMANTYSLYLLGSRVTYDITKRWDMSVLAFAFCSPQGHSIQYALGGEVGYQVQDNLWVSAGYNVRGFHDRDLSGVDYTNQGLYLRLRFKFDEDIFRILGKA